MSQRWVTLLERSLESQKWVTLLERTVGVPEMADTAGEVSGCPREE